MIREFPNFSGHVYKRPPKYEQNVGGRGDIDEYTAHAYQYATSSMPGELQPAAIIYAANEEDVLLAIQYARDADIALAVRTGGHHFWGHSSTNGENIQIDLSGFTKFDYDPATRTVKCGVGLDLFTIDEKLAELGAFVPHGQCGKVRAGGHLQSGGFSVFCGRSHGWFCDHVTEFRIICADLKTRIVHKPVPESPDRDNDDLWFAAIGGSPGNFGIVTELTLKPLWDADYPESRSTTVYMHYSREAHQALLQIVAEYNDRDDLPADFNLCAFVLGAYPLALRPNIDTRMMSEHPEIYGEGLEPHPTVLGLWATWCNLDGGAYSAEAQAFFADIKEKTKRYVTIVDAVLLKIMATVFGKVVPILGPDVAVPMSRLSQAYCFPKRVHANPYVSATWCGQSTSLSTNGFAAWAAKVTAEADDEDGCYPDFEWVVCGGKYSKNRTNALTNPTSVAWRDLTILCFQYVHYDQTDLLGNPWAGPGAFSFAWVPRAKAGAIGPNGKIGTEDHRWNAFPEQDRDLDANRKYYFQSEAVYQRVLDIKRRVDPNDVFTANRFCVGASRKYGPG
ncbi:MAG TPA: FAD-binding oxidoreductase [Labilithrix sp.]|nr:FAD-binding oxidoreductase [Labilithrix sp.]